MISFRSVRAGICFALFVECLVLTGCGQQTEEIDLKVSEASKASETFGAGAPSWLTQADLDERLVGLAERAEEFGITEPVPDLVRWIRPDEFATVMAPCLEAQGFTLVMGQVNGHREIVKATLPVGQEELYELGWWVCTAKYPQMPDSEHGVFSERTKRIMYEWAAKDLVACLEAEGFHEVTDIPSYEVFWERYENNNWHPYDWDVTGFGRSKGIDIEAKCPQWPTDGRLDYQYHEEK